MWHNGPDMRDLRPVRPLLRTARLGTDGTALQ